MLNYQQNNFTFTYKQKQNHLLKNVLWFALLTANCILARNKWELKPTTNLRRWSRNGYYGTRLSLFFFLALEIENECVRFSPDAVSKRVTFDHVRNEEVLLRVKEQRNILHEVSKRKVNWIGHILRRNCLLRQVIEVKIKGGTEVTRRRGSRRRKLLDDLKERRGYSHLKEEALDRTMWRARLGRGFGPVVRQTTKWMNKSSCMFLRELARTTAQMRCNFQEPVANHVIYNVTKLPTNQAVLFTSHVVNQLLTMADIWTTLSTSLSTGHSYFSYKSLTGQRNVSSQVTAQRYSVQHKRNCNTGNNVIMGLQRDGFLCLGNILYSTDDFCLLPPPLDTEGVTIRLQQSTIVLCVHY
jgi:hypothetical protein